MNSKSSYHHGDLRRALLDAGEKVLAERGSRGFTLRECARQANVSHAAPKHHFGDVRGLMTAIAARGFERLTRRLRRELKAASTLEDEFYATLHSYVGFAEKYPEHFRLMFRDDLLEADSEELKSAAAATFTELTNVILRQSGKPELGPEDLGDSPEFRATLDDIAIGWCHIHGFAHLRLEQQLVMVPGTVQKQLMRTSATRLSQMLQNQGLSSKTKP